MTEGNYSPVHESVDGITLKFDKTAGRTPLPDKEWLLALVAEVTKVPSTKPDWGPSINIEFHLKEEEHKGRKMWSNTSMILGPGTKLYEHYTSIMGLDELQDKQEIVLSEMKGKFCYIMVGPKKKDPTKQCIIGIKKCDKVPGNIEVTDSEGEAISEEASSAEPKASTTKVEKKTTEKKVEADKMNLDDIDIDEL